MQGNTRRTILLVTLCCCLAATLSSCGKREPSQVNLELLATNVHVSIAQHALVLPFIAQTDYFRRGQSFSLNRKRDNDHAQNALKQFLHDATDPQNPLALDGLSIVIETYGWRNDDLRNRRICPLLTRQWAQSVCDNPWAAIRQALPHNRFRLVNLNHLKPDDPRSPVNCRDNGKPPRPLPAKLEEAAMVCEAMVYGGDDDEFHSAVVRIDGDLGALWTVWRGGQNGETAEAMTAREGKAIVAFVRHALRKTEDFATLHAVMCDLRRPGSEEHPRDPDCGASPP